LSFTFDKQHPRDKKVKRAQEETNAAIAEIFGRYELSYGEVFFILSEYLNICAKVMMDKERAGTETRQMCPICGEPREDCQCRH
jgi:phage gp36-like protein